MNPEEIEIFKEFLQKMSKNLEEEGQLLKDIGTGLRLLADNGQNQLQTIQAFYDKLGIGKENK